MGSSLAVLGAVVIVLAVVAIAAGVALVRQSTARASRERLRADLEVEPALRGPEASTYLGGQGFPSEPGPGFLVLTSRRLLFRRPGASSVDVDLAEVTGVAAGTPRGAGPESGHCLILVTRGGDVAYQVDDVTAWRDALQRLLR